MRASHAVGLPNETHFVEFSQQDISDFLDYRCKGINPNTCRQIRSITTVIWELSQGRITPRILNDYTDYYMAKSESQDMRNKYYNYAKAFLKYLFKIRMENNILTLIAIFEKPNYRKEIKLMTSRIIVTEDIEHAIQTIRDAPVDYSYRPQWKLNFITALRFLAYGGQRPMTVQKLTVGQFRKALSQDPPVLKVEAKQDKIRMAHFVPLHSSLIESIKTLIEGKQDKDPMFEIVPLQTWLKNHHILMEKTEGHLMLKDIRKFFEQKSDEIGFNDSNKNFIMSHGVSSINWQSYKQFLPENVYKRYIECWGSVEIV
jgi:hypothetical protein